MRPGRSLRARRSLCRHGSRCPRRVPGSVRAARRWCAARRGSESAGAVLDAYPVAMHGLAVAGRGALVGDAAGGEEPHRVDLAAFDGDGVVVAVEDGADFDFEVEVGSGAVAAGADL